ncbi:uncharacterized protein K452DRAFT_301542 [Aplosporella prunicola CBS 121167]|uniref:Uncharacterized protein n=1 Tax=Aplosporella prunicola CBS 121167 TaxID=1176127 RepID=A0A6A6B466_9PEZI|nr:uncharacterized protein K452DRAFT_301542 [Aplosporella prunicola CBS 121167]KAF2138183.1 hypothetical protein K452DRAFT_301542 [Aplosporella prunicola CBS 121167]
MALPSTTASASAIREYLRDILVTRYDAALRDASADGFETLFGAGISGVLYKAVLEER